jgi:hypothetical protein
VSYCFPSAPLDFKALALTRFLWSSRAGYLTAVTAFWSALSVNSQGLTYSNLLRSGKKSSKAYVTRSDGRENPKVAPTRTKCTRQREKKSLALRKDRGYIVLLKGSSIDTVSRGQRQILEEPNGLYSGTCTLPVERIAFRLSFRFAWLARGKKVPRRE